MGSPARNRDSEITILLERVRSGDARARDQVITTVYAELRAMARHRLAAHHADSIQPTELVHEMYGRLFGKGQLDWANRRHFFAVASRAMQDIVVERARAAVAEKRGGGQQLLSLSFASGVAQEAPEDLLLLDLALERLGAEDHLAAEVVRLRYFVGLSGDECAQALGVSPATVDRRWVFARAWLLRELRSEHPTQSVPGIDCGRHESST